MFGRAPALQVEEVEKRQLESLARVGTTPQKTGPQMPSDRAGKPARVAQRTGLSRPTILASGSLYQTGDRG